MVSDAEVCWMKTVSRPVEMSCDREPAGDLAGAVVETLAARRDVMWWVACFTFLDGDALGQVARLVDVAAAAHGDVIRQQLQRHDLENRQQQLAGVRNGDDVVGDAGGFVSPSLTSGDDDPFARLDFLNIGDGLLVKDAAARARDWIVRGQHDHGQLLVDQRVGAMLHLARGIAFGVDVGDLLQLERAFERDGEMDAAAEEEKVGGAEKLAAQFLVVRVVREDGFELSRGCAAAPAPGSARWLRPSRSRTWPRYMARMKSAVNWPVKALVEATPISGPACV